MRGCSRVRCDLVFWLFEPRFMEMSEIESKNRMLWIYFEILTKANDLIQHNPFSFRIHAAFILRILSQGIELRNLVRGMIWPAVLKCLAEILPKDFYFLAPCNASLDKMTKRWEVLCDRVLQAWLLVLGTCGERREQRRINGRLPSLPLGVYGPHRFEMSAWLEKLH